MAAEATRAENDRLLGSAIQSVNREAGHLTLVKSIGHGRQALSHAAELTATNRMEIGAQYLRLRCSVSLME